MPGFTAPEVVVGSRTRAGDVRPHGRVLLPKDFVRAEVDRREGQRHVGCLRHRLAGCGPARLVRCHAGGNRPHALAHAAAGGRHRASGSCHGSRGRAVADSRGSSLPAVAVTTRRAPWVWVSYRPGQAFLSLGTSGVLFVVTDQFRPNPDRAAHAFCHCLPEPLAPDVGHVERGERARLGGAADGRDGSAAAGRSRAGARAAPRQSPFFLPYLSGERTPHNDPQCPRRLLRHPPRHGRRRI